MIGGFCTRSGLGKKGCFSYHSMVADVAHLPPPLLLIPCKVNELAIKDNYRGTLSKLFLGEQQGHRLCVVKNLQSVFIVQILYNP